MAYTVLITGANRGIGRDLLKLYLNLPQTTAIAAVRNLAHPSVDDLRSLPVASGSRLIVVKIDSAFLEDPKDAVAVLRNEHGITQLDTIIANAGIGKDWSLVAQTDIAEVEDHFKINSVGPFTLYLATRSLLLASANPKFIVLSTELGSIGLQGERKIQDVAYGMSKAAVNFFVGKLHHEEPKLTAFPIHPGWVKTSLGNAIAETLGMKEAPTTQEQSAAGIFEQVSSKVEKSTKAETSGRFITFEGKDIPW
ncbi:hypothetical protein NCS57_00952200 [Fusarium keratoplasticum]|uniref:Uncharacterized protein n=1 Tax=Fusarium keratoplasticum TaxID=1328300 RepID=A0ACC0QSD9_9HYPO|nr:hypothetical protein NCS57_00952200 [Fusarium keratoplasticum]KAI8663509.1 hypothetical protein NCS57_00952200 [Fusarium keratoplasticum]